MRQSNLELCRIVAMILILLVHSAFATFGSPEEWAGTSLWLITLQAIGVTGVNVFVMISGYFGIKLKVESVLRLLYCCCFYGIIIICYNLYNDTFSYKQLLFVSEANWFITAYLGLMLLSPILNLFVKQVNEKQLGVTIVGLLIFEWWHDYIPKMINEFHGGYSILSFVIVYLIAGYLRKIGGGQYREECVATNLFSNNSFGNYYYVCCMYKWFTSRAYMW